MRLIRVLTDGRLAVDLTQEDVAKKLKRPQSFVSKYESGERRLDVIEMMEVCDALGLNTVNVIEQLLVLK